VGPHERPVRPPSGTADADPPEPYAEPAAGIRERSGRDERREGDVKELRVKIDVSYHLKLHALKLLRNKKMSEAVEEALDHYFAHVVQDPTAPDEGHG